MSATNRATPLCFANISSFTFLFFHVFFYKDRKELLLLAFGFDDDSIRAGRKARRDNRQRANFTTSSVIKEKMNPSTYLFSMVTMTSFCLTRQIFEHHLSLLFLSSFVCFDFLSIVV